jgi:hypothetical protein
MPFFRSLRSRFDWTRVASRATDLPPVVRSQRKRVVYFSVTNRFHATTSQTSGSHLGKHHQRDCTGKRRQG